jgi:hypothetical protein
MSEYSSPQLFRLRLSVLLPVYLVFAQLCALVGALALWAFTFDLTWQGFLRIYLVLTILATVAAIARTLRAALQRIEVGLEGIRGRPGPIEPIYWDAIQTVRVTRWSVLSYLELETQKDRKHRFPLYLADLPGFVAAVERFAGEDHPLTWALWEWMEVKSE